MKYDFVCQWNIVREIMRCGIEYKLIIKLQDGNMTVCGRTDPLSRICNYYLCHIIHLLPYHPHVRLARSDRSDLSDASTHKSEVTKQESEKERNIRINLNSPFCKK